NLRVETAAGKCVCSDVDGLSNRDLRAHVRGQRKIDIELREIRQRDNPSPRSKVLPDLDLAGAERAGKRGADQLLRDQRFGLEDHRPCLVELTLLLVDGFPRLELALSELARALQCGLRPAGLSFVTG